MSNDKEPGFSSNANYELPTTEKILKKAGELAIVYGDIEEYEATEDESLHRTFVLCDEGESTLLRRRGLCSIKFVPSYLLEGIPTDDQAVFEFMPTEGVAREIVLLGNGEVQVHNGISDNAANDTAVARLVDKSQEEAQPTIENLYGVEAQRYFDKLSAEKLDWIYFRLNHPDELEVDDALKLEHALFDIERDLAL